MKEKQNTKNKLTCGMMKDYLPVVTPERLLSRLTSKLKKMKKKNGTYNFLCICSPSRWLFEELTEVLKFSYLLEEGFGCNETECFCGNEVDGYTCNILLMRLNDYFIETKETRARTLFESLSLIGGFGGLIMAFFRFVNRFVN